MSLPDASVEIAIVVTKTLTLCLGGLVTYFAYRAFTRTGALALRALAVGFGVMTAGLVLAGFGDLVLGLPTVQSVFLESALTTVALGVIVYSLYAKGRQPVGR